MFSSGPLIIENIVLVYETRLHRSIVREHVFSINAIKYLYEY